MLFISNAAGYTLKLRNAKSVYTPQGDLLAVNPKIKAVFQHGVAPRWAIEQALANGLTVTGKPDGHDLNPYFSAYDTNAAAELEDWDEKTKAWVEERMLANSAYGSTYIKAEPARLKAPWPAYDTLVAVGGRTEKMVADKIAATVLENGYDAAEVIAYEAENGNRPGVIEALNEIVALEAAEEPVAA